MKASLGSSKGTDLEDSKDLTVGGVLGYRRRRLEPLRISIGEALFSHKSASPAGRPPAFSRYETYVRIVVDGPAAP
jgi:hypothetical protein